MLPFAKDVVRKCRLFHTRPCAESRRTNRDTETLMTDPKKPKLHESFYSVFSAVFSCIMLGLVAYLAYDWLNG